MTNEKREKYSLKDKSFAAIEEDFMQTTAHRLSYSERTACSRGSRGGTHRVMSEILRRPSARR